MTSVRGKVVGRIADHLAAQHPGHPVRAAVDGITAAGKSTLAAELAAALRDRGREVIHLSMDGFHHPRAHRHRRGRDSADGYYEDAYDVASFARLVLAPLGLGGDGRYRSRIIDLATDRPIDEPAAQAAPDAVLVVDGSLLQRPELSGLWDEVVFVDTSPAIARIRGTRRDAAVFDGLAGAEQAYERRYHAACRRYVEAVGPVDRASVVIGNDDLDQPELRRIGGPVDGVVRLFSYGTLRKADVQLANFGRQLVGTPDTLPAHRSDWVTITDPDVVAASGSDRHPIIRPTGDPGDSVAGIVFTLTTAELAAADGYEVEDYRRVLVRLGSGSPAWVYLAAETP